MKEVALKIDLIDKIEHADFKQLQEIYGLVINYFNSKSDVVEEWDLLPEYQKQQILKGLEEADAGLGTPAKEVIQKAREKHGLNG
ncbi:MAG: hypothetical protein ACHQIM_13865 [Sphingobacteriales bacterium]